MPKPRHPKPRHPSDSRSGRAAATAYGYRVRGLRPARPVNDNRRSTRSRSVPILVGAWLCILVAIAMLLWRAGHP